MNFCRGFPGCRRELVNLHPIAQDSGLKVPEQIPVETGEPPASHVHARKAAGCRLRTTVRKLLPSYVCAWGTTALPWGWMRFSESNPQHSGNPSIWAQMNP